MRIRSFSLLTMFYLLLAAAPAMADIVYSNGPYNGTTSAWLINFGEAVSDSFTGPLGTSITGLHIVYWNVPTTNVLTTVDMSIGSTSFGSDGFRGTLTDVNNTFLGLNQFGYALYRADYFFPGIPWSGDGYVTLSNACTTDGCSVNYPIYWDENSGPSRGYDNRIGLIPSEAFTLTGTISAIPEPSSILLLGSGILGLGGILRRRF